MTEEVRVKPRVAVIGVGAMGSMAMWRLALSGYDVTGFERFGVPHDRGGHGAETRIYRMAYREGGDYIPLLRRSHALWQELSALSGRSLFIQNGCLYISDGSGTWMDETIASAQAQGVPIIELNDSDLAARYPQHRLEGGERAILDLMGGTLRPEQAVLAAAQQAVRLGATLREDAAVVDVTPVDGGVDVRVDGEDAVRFDYVVVTSGAWTSQFQKSLGFGIMARRLPGTWFPAVDPRQFSPERFPVCLRTAGDLNYSGFPCVDGWSVKVMPPVFADNETIAEHADRDVRGRDVDYTRDIVRKLLNGVIDRPARTGVFLDGFGASDRPVIDYSTDSRRVVGAVGFAGHGFKYSPAVGQILADLISAESGHADPELIEIGMPFARDAELSPSDFGRMRR
ncbi:FAD-dependent oxidoreductase [Microbacterium sp. XT11]|uniref:FAD-dependent oxidoreductase n=1 Tax=Microbacterium sp. XT11 TaxID=367477 RepID=UPI000742DB01|nr:FAD-dependent oxidoreductase [Microbacterium sp. XT11]ALX65916.1 sarcosine oxidase [Microbacterium sp. XT11]